MSQHINHHDAPTETTPGRAFPRRLFGYDRGTVEDAIARLDLRISDLEQSSVDLREEMLDAQQVASEAQHDLTRARAELRYWNDRASYVDSEVARARQRATELEESARLRAETIEADAQERSLQLIDRVCGEANAMLQAAREEAREMFLRFETDVDMSQQKLEMLEQVRTNVASTMQDALAQFESAVRELDKVAPAKRIVETLQEPQRRSVPTFGQQKALQAARRFDDEASRTVSEALSTPLTSTNSFAATVTDVTDVIDEDVLEAKVPATPATDDVTSDDVTELDTETTSPHRSYEPDAEFVSMLMRP